MADILPFRSKPSPKTASSKCDKTSFCTEQLQCPACHYVAKSRCDLNSHLDEAHPPVSNATK